MADAPPPIITALMSAPTNIMNLATKQITEAVNAFNAGAQGFAAAAAVPPPFPIPGQAGMQAFPFPFPPFGGMGAPGAAEKKAPAQAPVTEARGYPTTGYAPSAIAEVSVLRRATITR